MEWLKNFFEQALKERSKEGGRFILSFFTLKTNVLLEISERGRSHRQLQIPLLLAGTASVLLALIAWLNDVDPSPDKDAYFRVTLINFVLLAAVSLPFFLAYYLFRKRIPFFVANVLLTQLVLMTVGVGLASLIVNSVEQSHTELRLYRNGKGQGTLPYQRNCGMIEAQAEQIALVRATLVRKHRNEADPRRLQAARPRNEGEETDLQQRRRALAASQASDADEGARASERLRALQARVAGTEALFQQTYPGFSLANRLTTAIGWIGLLLTLFHLVRGIFFSAGSRRSALARFAGLLLSCIGTVTIWYVLDLAFRDSTRSDVAASHLKQSGGRDPSVSIDAQLRQLHADRNNLREIAEQLRPQCGEVDSHGLW